MRIRASVLTPILALLTVVALIGTGIALGQARHGDADATLLDSTPSSTVAAVTEAEAEPDAGPPETADASLVQPADQVVELVESVPVASTTTAGAQGTAASSPTKAPIKSPAKSPTTTPTAPPPTDAPDPPESDDDGHDSDQPAEPDEPDHDEEPESDSDETDDD